IDYPGGENFKKFWPADIQLIALDILKFHAIFWPAILIALDLPLPKRLAIHGFFTIDGKKMSKTLGNVVNPNDLVDKYGADATKYLILSQFGFGSESDINVSEFSAKYKADLVNGLGNLVNRVTNMVQNYLNGKIDIKLKENMADICMEYIDRTSRKITVFIGSYFKGTHSKYIQSTVGTVSHIQSDSTG
ncbi:MAG TPA: class I tRNA ligase family protein, partial [Candidatus Gracilibacteria bacterium]|nr:class I tRNA ligase family protein [Candidatus Gracilibacteria bacterium]